MKDIKEVIENDCFFMQHENICHFITDENERPFWSLALQKHLTEDKIDLKMSERYRNQKDIVSKDAKRMKFFDYISETEGIKVDLASGPSGYFSPILNKLKKEDLFIITDACPAVIKAHAEACRQDPVLIFDLDLDKGLPFIDESISSFSGNLLNNINNYPDIIKEIYRCLKHGGHFAAIEVFFEQGCKTYEHLKKENAIWASFETFVSYCESIGFVFEGSDILKTRIGKIAEGDLYPLNDLDMSADRTVYFKKI